MSVSKAKIVSIGTAVPKYQYQQEHLADWMAESLDTNDKRLKRKLNVLYQKTSIQTRYSVLNDFNQHSTNNRLFNSKNNIPLVEDRLSIYRDEVVQLSIQAIKNCLMNIDYQTISHLIFVSCTGMTAPGVEIQLKKELSLNQHVQTHAINFIGCYAVFSALKLADALCNGNKNANILIVSTELCTLHFQNKIEDDFILSNSLFSDGSAAALISNQLLPQQKGLTILEQKQTHIYKGEQDMAWDINSEGILMRLSSYIPQLVNSKIKHILSNTLASDQLNSNDIKHWAIHPGGRKILEVCEKELILTQEQLASSYSILKNYGNMSAPTILFVLKELLEKESTKKHDFLFACGFGPGFTLEGALFNIC